MTTDFQYGSEEVTETPEDGRSLGLKGSTSLTSSGLLLNPSLMS